MTDESAKTELARCRTQIDELDRRILQLLNERTNIVEKIGQVKARCQMAIYEPKREDEVYANITNNNHGPLPSDAARRIFERIIDEMRTVQRNNMQAKKESC